MKSIPAMALLSVVPLPGVASAQQPSDALPTDHRRPNVLWIYVEDTNDWMSCYGDELIETPNIDALAEARHPVHALPTCRPASAARRARPIITGMHQTTIGAHQHYSSFEVWRGIEMDEWDPNYLGVRTIPEILRLARYYTFNKGKLHYNFVYDIDQLYDHHGREDELPGRRRAVLERRSRSRPTALLRPDPADRRQDKGDAAKVVDRARSAPRTTPITQRSARRSAGTTTRSSTSTPPSAASSRR